MADYQRQGDPWINDAAPAINAPRLTAIEDGILDAVTHHKHGPIADRPDASPANKNWLYIASDGPAAVSDGAVWLEGALAPGTEITPWTDLPLLNGWTSFVGRPVQYRFEQAGRVLRFRGTLDGLGRTDPKFADVPAEVLAQIQALERYIGVTTWTFNVGIGSGAVLAEADGALRGYPEPLRTLFLEVAIGF